MSGDRRRSASLDCWWPMPTTFLGVREDPEAPDGFVYAWANVALTDHGKRLMGHLPEKVGSLMVNYESGRWQVQEAGEVVAEGYVPFS